MKPDIFMDDFSRDPETDKYYAVLGRALAFATRFELNCRQLARFLALRMNPESSASPSEPKPLSFKKQLRSRWVRTLTLSDRTSLTYPESTSGRCSMPDERHGTRSHMKLGAGWEKCLQTLPSEMFFWSTYSH